MSPIHYKSTVVLVYRNSKRKNAIFRIKHYKHKSIDEILNATNRKLHIPERAVIVHLGLGKIFEKKYKRRYKI